MSVFLSVRDIAKSFGGLQALDAVSFEVAKGEIVAVIGANGAGKTTLFNIVSGLLTPDTGSVVFDGTTVTRLRPDEHCRRGIARTFQTARSFHTLTALENAVVGALNVMHGVQEATAHARRALEFVGLGGRLHDYAGDLTIGQQRRLELARALATKPRLLLLDEVMAGLNPGEVGSTVELVRRVRDSGVTVLLIEHVMQATMSLADRVVVLDFGRKLTEGRPEEVTKNPLVIKAFLGEEAHTLA
jgi:branched-chain amino acid transport system ATP-binding protein